MPLTSSMEDYLEAVLIVAKKQIEAVSYTHLTLPTKLEV